MMSDKTSCNKFCEYFAFVLKSSNNNIANFLPRYHLKSTIDDICFNSDDIVKVIHCKKSTVSHGPDKLFCFFITKIATSLALPLSLLFHYLLYEGNWKTVCIVSLYKG